ncbi:hypothetical protein L1987_35117 [Smallanthus sonchifolius]|uniref:Uncharacterized protein n=1 Tax=Smallanthus sonchifolius TaxID=185202 RepID=A0ACB9HWI9_9ASTR|nr:hypothetical protein L1987_35117 [Smallanthus sonchifolius]
MTTQASGRKKPVNIVRVIKAPIRAISKVLHLYAKSVTNFSNAYNRPLRTMVEVAPNCQKLPRSFTTSRLPDNDQPPEGALVRSTSTSAITNFELYIIQHHSHQLQASASMKAVSRNCIIGMGKIDEDRVSSFRDDNIILKSKLCVKNEDSVFLKSRGDDARVSTKRVNSCTIHFHQMEM